MERLILLLPVRLLVHFRYVDMLLTCQAADQILVTLLLQVNIFKSLV